jgi:hypothetical protein
LIELPLGCLILISSAVLTKANTPIQAGKKHTSFMQYFSGAFFCYSNNRFMMQDEFQASVSDKEFKARMKKKEMR